MPLSPEARTRVDRRVAACEALTGAQVVAAVVGKSDDYPEIPWRAFALGASVTALGQLLFDLARPDWLTGYELLAGSVLILGAGAALALLTVRWHAFARIFLTGLRAEAEVMQHAQVLFLRHETFATPARNGVLILVSVFERQVVILPDTGLHAAIGNAELQPVIAAMTPLLAAGKVADALCAGVAGVERLLAAAGFRPGRGEGVELPDSIVDEGGSNARA